MRSLEKEILAEAKAALVSTSRFFYRRNGQINTGCPMLHMESSEETVILSFHPCFGFN